MAAACAAALLLGCGSDFIAIDDEFGNAVIGTFYLVTYDGKGVPYVLQEGQNDKTELLGIRIIVARGMTFQSTRIHRNIHSGNVTIDTTLASGYITPTGASAMRLKTTDGTETTATIDGNWLTHVTALHTMRYWKYSACNIEKGTYTPC